MRSNGSEQPEPLPVTEPTLSDALESVFGIQHHEYRVLVAVTRLPGSTAAELANDLDRDRSNINRSLSSLYDLSLIERERRLLDGGGYVYQYYASPPDETKARFHAGVEAWAETVHESIDNFEP